MKKIKRILAITAAVGFLACSVQAMDILAQTDRTIEVLPGLFADIDLVDGILGIDDINTLNVGEVVTRENAVDRITELVQAVIRLGAMEEALNGVDIPGGVAGESLQDRLINYIRALEDKVRDINRMVEARQLRQD